MHFVGKHKQTKCLCDCVYDLPLHGIYRTHVSNTDHSAGAAEFQNGIVFKTHVIPKLEKLLLANTLHLIFDIIQIPE